jgi:hypothetical protein
LALTLAVAVGCGGTSSPPVVTVNVTLINNGGDLPDEFTQLVVDCQQDFKDGQHGKCRDRARDAKKSTDTTVQAAAEVLDVVAATNEGEYDEGAQNAADAEAALDQLPPGTRETFALALFRSETIGATARGDKAGAARAVQQAGKISPDARERAEQDRCQTDSSAPGCTPTVGPTPSTEPTSDPTAAPTSTPDSPGPAPESTEAAETTASTPTTQPESGPSPEPAESTPQADGT